jgi:putative endonuclease
MSRALGLAFELDAARYLEARGFRVIARNFSCRGGELDLVCEEGDTVVFVEVRARARDELGAPEETIGALKRRRIVRAARYFLYRAGWTDRPCRIDVIAILGARLLHIEDAFGAST